MLPLAEQSKGKAPDQTQASWYETRAIEFSRLQIGVKLLCGAADECLCGPCDASSLTEDHGGPIILLPPVLDEEGC